VLDLLIVMVGWGDKVAGGRARPPVLYRHHTCGQISAADLRCVRSGEPMLAGDIDLLPGPGRGGLTRRG
jgi:hypothetical protein